MLERTETSFAGHDCVKLRDEALALWVTRSTGPRIIGLAPAGRDNLFALLPDATVDCPGVGPFFFRGGHRLWYAPEDPSRTYLPDNDPVAVVEVQDGLQVAQPVERPTGIQKSMTITLPGDGAHVVVDHRIQNLGRSPIELAPWAITQLRTGGVAILPQPTAAADEHGLLPNRHIALWPYTQIASPHITWGDQFILIRAAMGGGALKVGFPNPAGWLGYLLEDTLFVKWADYDPGATYFDRGCSSECYCNPSFLELETLAPRGVLAPGESVAHRETWRVFAGVDFTPDQDAVHELVSSLGL